MLQNKVHIDGYDWVISLDTRNQLSFYFEKLETDEYAGLFWEGGDDSPSSYYIGSVDDNVLPKNISPIKVIRRLISEIALLINRSKVHFFYFNPSTDRKSKFYINIFKSYLPLLNGNWTYQIIDGSWFYFTREVE
jgi:hypothetical protein